MSGSECGALARPRSACRRRASSGKAGCGRSHSTRSSSSSASSGPTRTRPERTLPVPRPMADAMLFSAESFRWTTRFTLCATPRRVAARPSFAGLVGPAASGIGRPGRRREHPGRRQGLPFPHRGAGASGDRIRGSRRARRYAGAGNRRFPVKLKLDERISGRRCRRPGDS